MDAETVCSCADLFIGLFIAGLAKAISTDTSKCQKKKKIKFSLEWYTEYDNK